MNFKLETPNFVREAQAVKKGWNWFVELLVFVLVFIIVTIGEVMIILPVELVVMFTDKDYITAIQTGDEVLLMEAANRIAESDALVIGMLFANIAITLIVMLF